MISVDNPFSPNFGSDPLYLAGRSDELARIESVSLNLARRDFSRATLITGQRGTGETVLLNRVQDAAEQAGWLVVRETANSGFLERLLTVSLPNLLALVEPDRHVSGQFTISGGPIPVSASLSTPPRTPRTRGLREYVADITSALGPQRGLLFALDEVNSAARSQLEEFAGAYQLAVGSESRNVALVMCGVQSALRKMLSGKTAMSFLARAQQVELGVLPLETAVAAFRNTLSARGTKTVDAPTLDRMARLSRGHPFLIQEVGYLAWDAHADADAASATISLADVDSIAEAAIRAMRTSVLSVILRDVSGRYRRALTAIALNPDITTAQLGAELGIPTTSVGDVHLRLIEAGLIARDPHNRGRVRILVPYLAEHLIAEAEGDSAAGDQLSALDTYLDA